MSKDAIDSPDGIKAQAHQMFSNPRAGLIEVEATLVLPAGAG